MGSGPLVTIRSAIRLLISMHFGCISVNRSTVFATYLVAHYSFT
jgi:hypothetical protein